MRLKPKHIVWIMVLAVLVPLGVYLLNADQPGKTKQSGDVITKTLGTGAGKTTSEFDILLQEGGDPVHEADHVFDAVKKPGVASASFDINTNKLAVIYDESVVTEADVRQMLVTAGYVRVTAGDAVQATMSPDGLSQALSITPTDKTLEPRFVRAKAGVPLKLEFGPGVAHLASINIAELGIKQDLTNGGTVEIKDPKPGTYNIMCAEGFPDGTLIVE